MNWSRIFNVAGKIGLYICLIAVVLLNTIKIFIPDLNYDANLSITMSLIGIGMIAILSQLDKILTKKKIHMASNKFFEGLNYIFAKGKVLESLDIIAYTSRTYCACIRNEDIVIKKVRLLVYKPRSLPVKKLSNSPEFTVSKETISLWQDMLNKGKIHSLDIRYFDFVPTYHFALIDHKYYHFGFYLTQPTYPWYSLLTSFTSLDSTDGSECFRKDFATIFENYFSNYSYVDSDGEAYGQTR